jgi:putative FmdB family regulatory protein
MPLYDFRCAKGHRFDKMVSLAQFSEIQLCDCGEPSERLISAPFVISDSLPPTMGADGRMHDSRASYHRSLTPSGNPKGEAVHVLGAGEKVKPVAHKVDKQRIREDVARSIAEVKQGRRVTPVSIEGV